MGPMRFLSTYSNMMKSRVETYSNYNYLYRSSTKEGEESPHCDEGQCF